MREALSEMIQDEDVESLASYIILFGLENTMVFEALLELEWYLAYVASNFNDHEVFDEVVRRFRGLINESIALRRTIARFSDPGVDRASLNEMMESINGYGYEELYHAALKNQKKKEIKDEVLLELGKAIGERSVVIHTGELLKLTKNGQLTSICSVEGVNQFKEKLDEETRRYLNRRESYHRSLDMIEIEKVVKTCVRVMSGFLGATLSGFSKKNATLAYASLILIAHHQKELESIVDRHKGEFDAKLEELKELEKNLSDLGAITRKTRNIVLGLLFKNGISEKEEIKRLTLEMTDDRFKRVWLMALLYDQLMKNLVLIEDQENQRKEDDRDRVKVEMSIDLITKEDWDAVAEIGLPAVGPLIDLMGNENEDVSNASAKTLGKIGGVRAVTLIDALVGDSWNVHDVVAAEALGEIGDGRAVEALIVALKDERWDVRLASAEALGKIGDARAVDALTDALKDEHWDIRRASAEALGKIMGTRVNTLFALIKDSWNVSEGSWNVNVNDFVNDGVLALEPLFRLTDERMVELQEALIVTLKDKVSDVRRASAVALGEIGVEQAVEALIVALKDKVSDVRRASVEALVKIGEPAVKALIVALGDKDKEVRRASAMALVKIGEPAVKALTDALLKKNENRGAGPLARIWGAINDSRTLNDTLSIALEGEYGFVRRASAVALGEIGDPRAVEALIVALKNKDWHVRSESAEALGNIGDARAVDALIGSLGNKNWVVRRAAASTLGEIGDARAVDVLIDALGDEDKRVRRATAEALGNIGDARAVGSLIGALKDEDRYVHSAAVEALSQIEVAGVVANRE